MRFEFQWDYQNIQKFSDDAAQVGPLTRGNDLNDLAYKREVESFVSWCNENLLKLNVGKTKELVIDVRRKEEEVSPVRSVGE